MHSGSFLIGWILVAARLVQAQVGNDGQAPKLRLPYNLTTPYPDARFFPEKKEFTWVDHGSDDGWTLVGKDGGYILQNVITEETQPLINASHVPKNVNNIALNVNSSKALFGTNAIKGYRYSIVQNCFVLDIKTAQLQPLHPEQKNDIQYAAWSPKDPKVIAFVWRNNIFNWNDGQVTQITKDGVPGVVYNGVPDWVYEEEVIEKRFTLWFSPDGEYLAYLSFNDTEVPVYTVPYYMYGHEFAPPYPRTIPIRYPKPGFPNPIVSASVFKLSEPDKQIAIPIEQAFPKDDLVTGEVAWVTSSHRKLIIRCFNRIQNQDKHLLFNVESKEAKIVRERKPNDGWLDNNKAIKYVGKLDNSGPAYYLDTSDEDGWSHIYLYPVDGGKPKQLTSGKWEVRSIDKINRKTGIVYFSSAEVHPTEAHIFSVSMLTGEKKALVNLDTGSWGASYSRGGQYVALNYAGPSTPYQRLYYANKTDNEAITTLANNTELDRTLTHYALPTIKYLDLQHPKGYNLSAMIQFPPNFSESKKYPVLLTPYGGPGSQEVEKKFQVPSWKAFISSHEALEYITYTVDNRGTGFRGRDFRNAYYKTQGTVDVEDQIWATKELMKNPWVDADHIGIWGWSNGGFLTLKVVEANSGIINFAIATAPTSDERLYDSIYSERFMGSLKDNKAAYDKAAVRNATGFRTIPGGVLIQHGLGDDNVHAVHTLGLVSYLMAQGVSPRQLQVQMFTDSDHNIRYSKDQQFLYRQLTQKLFDEKKRQPKVSSEKLPWDRKRLTSFF